MKDGLKACVRCGETRPVTAFWPDTRRASGYEGACKDCRNGGRRGKRSSNLEASRAYRARHPERHVQQRREWERRNPEKDRAQHAVRNAVRDGRFVKPASCESCNREAVLHGHHPDYSQPLSVVWVCPACHKAIHREIEEQSA